MTKFTEFQQTKIAEAKQDKLQNVLYRASGRTETKTFSCKVDSTTLAIFKGEIEKFNDNNPDKKLKIGKIMDEIMYDFYKELRILNSNEEQAEMDI